MTRCRGSPQAPAPQLPGATPIGAVSDEGPDVNGDTVRVPPDGSTKHDGERAPLTAHLNHGNGDTLWNDR